MSHPIPGEDYPCEYCGKDEDECECPHEFDREQPEPDPDMICPGCGCKDDGGNCIACTMDR